MKLTKAIEILDLCVKVGTEEATPDTNTALRLGIEALQRLQYMRRFTYTYSETLLRGETKEYHSRRPV